MAKVAYVIDESTVECPDCGHRKTEKMPTEFCQWYYDCEGCGKLLSPMPGDCCVFCSFGTVPCPPIQIGDACCSRIGDHEPLET